MRLQLDSLSSRAAELAGTEATARPGTTASGNRVQADAAGQDSSYVSGPSGILNRLAADRADRLQQLAGLIQSGSYDVSAAAVSRAIVDQSLQ